MEKNAGAVGNYWIHAEEGFDEAFVEDDVYYPYDELDKVEVWDTKDDPDGEWVLVYQGEKTYSELHGPSSKGEWLFPEHRDKIMMGIGEQQCS